MHDDNGFGFELFGSRTESPRDENARVELVKATDNYHQLKKDIRELIDGIGKVVGARCWDIAVDLANELNNKSLELAAHIREVQKAYDAYVTNARS